MVIIIGAGLSGLLIGYRLKSKGIPFKILEARDRVGGRIHTINSINNTPVEMGATWFGNQHTQLKELLNELDLSYSKQFLNGTAFFQPFSTSPANAITIPNQSPNYRINGGTSTLIETLVRNIGIENILLNETVKELDFSNERIRIDATKTYYASKVVLALPPKLWSKHIRILPTLSPEIMKTALTTHTWMEDAIKIALTYKTPFWKLKNQSGTLFSNSGPITELYDHCNAEGTKFALCGFINTNYSELSYEERKECVLNQMVSVFGNEAKTFIDYNEVDWSKEQNTFSKNLVPLYPHQNNGASIYIKQFFNKQLFISSSETAFAYAGYMEGAVISANYVAKEITMTHS